jgi:hypothetical protein
VEVILTVVVVTVVLAVLWGLLVSGANKKEK